MTLVFASIGALALVVILTAQVCGYLGYALFDGRMWLGFLLFNAVLIPFAAMIVHIHARLGKRPSLRDFAGLLPAWAWSTVGIAVIYAVTLVTLRLQAPPGWANETNGKLVLEHKSTVIRELTPDEFRELRARQTVETTGHPLVFCLLPLLFFATSARRRTSNPVAGLRVRAASPPEAH